MRSCQPHRPDTPTDPVELEQARSCLRHSADARRNRGGSRESAIRYVAEYYGMALRRVQCLIFGESVRLHETEMVKIVARFREHLEEEAKYATAQAVLHRDRARRIAAGEVVDYTREPGTEHITKRSNLPRKRDRHSERDEWELTHDSDP